MFLRGMDYAASSQMLVAKALWMQGEISSAYPDSRNASSGFIEFSAPRLVAAD